MSDIEVALRHRLGGLELEVDFSVPAQGTTALFGPSGCGKTSVLRAIAGLLRPREGRVRVFGESWQDGARCLPPHRRSVGYVFQEENLFPHLTVRGNLEYGWRRTPPAERRVGFEETVEMLGLAPLLDRDSRELSGGERQRVAIGRALLASPRLLLMDEPLSALDQPARQAILPHLEGLYERFGIPMLYVTHDPLEAARLADTLVLLDNGRCLAQGRAAEMLTRLDLPIVELDEAAAVLEGRVAGQDDAHCISWIAIEGGRLGVACQALTEGQRVRVEIKARDVSLSLSRHTDTSIINILQAKVEELRECGRAQVMVRLRLAGGQPLLSRITRRSATLLDLRPELELYAQVKAVALVA